MIDTVFRAWYYKDERMIKEAIELEMLFLAEPTYEHPPYSHIGFISKHEGRIADLMMYSNMLDKNGDLICDGDIIYMDTYTKPLLVVFTGCSFILTDHMANSMRSSGDYLGWFKSEHMYIIGNKYEGIRPSVPRKIRSMGEMFLKELGIPVL